MRHYSELNRVERYEVNLVIALAVAFACYFVTIYLGNLDTEVMSDRFWKNAEPLAHGEIPITEYPPFALFFFAIPRIFAGTPWGYNAAYVVLTYVAAVAGLVYMRRIAEAYGISQTRAMVIYGVLIVMFLQFVTDRYDIFPMVMTLA